MNLVDFAYAQETAPVVGATQEAVEPGVAASLGLNGTLFIFQLINFAIVAVIIWFLILKPLTKKMTERQKLVDESIDNAKRIQDTLQKSEQKYQDRIDQAKVEANKVIEKASHEAEMTAADMKVKAKEEIDGLVVQAKHNLSVEKDEMMIELKQETAELIATALEKILGEKVDVKKDRAMIEEMIQKIK